MENMPSKKSKAPLYVGVVIVALAVLFFSGVISPENFLAGRGGGGNPDKVVFCHATGSSSNPFVVIEVDLSAKPAHKAHGDKEVARGFSKRDCLGSQNPSCPNEGQPCTSVCGPGLIVCNLDGEICLAECEWIDENGEPVCDSPIACPVLP